MNAAAAGLLAAAFFDLWLTLVGDSTTSDSTGLLTSPNSRAAAVVAFVAAQGIFKVKGPTVILLGLALGCLQALMTWSD